MNGQLGTATPGYCSLLQMKRNRLLVTFEILETPAHLLHDKIKISIAPAKRIMDPTIVVKDQEIARGCCWCIGKS